MLIEPPTIIRPPTFIRRWRVVCITVVPEWGLRGRNLWAPPQLRWKHFEKRPSNWGKAPRRPIGILWKALICWCLGPNGSRWWYCSWPLPTWSLRTGTFSLLDTSSSHRWDRQGSVQKTNCKLNILNLARKFKISKCQKWLIKTLFGGEKIWKNFEIDYSLKKVNVSNGILILARKFKYSVGLDKASFYQILSGNCKPWLSHLEAPFAYKTMHTAPYAWLLHVAYIREQLQCFASCVFEAVAHFKLGFIATSSSSLGIFKADAQTMKKNSSKSLGLFPSIPVHRKKVPVIYHSGNFLGTNRAIWGGAQW